MTFVMTSICDGDPCPEELHFHYRVEGRTVHVWNPHADCRILSGGGKSWADCRCGWTSPTFSGPIGAGCTPALCKRGF